MKKNMEMSKIALDIDNTIYKLKIKGDGYKVFPVYYPVGNGIFNIDKSIEDIKWIINHISI